MAQSRSVFFTAPGRVELREQLLPAPGADQVMVETVVSAISCGTEMLVYRGQFPRELTDEHDALSSGLHYPLPYGYACIGRVKSIGRSVNRDWEGRLVFAFQPHSSHFISAPEALIPIPASLSAEAAAFLPGMETAVNLVQDAAPILGERALVLGQGIIGLLTAALLHEFPLECLVTADRFSNRRAAALEAGASAALDPASPDFRAAALRHAHATGYDLTLEVSGSPAALDDAIALTAFSGRIVIGSWYGEKQAPVDLGGKFHRSRIRLVSSQVSTIAPELAGRWDKPRRFAVAWEALRRVRPEKWITHRFPVERAKEAYELLDKSPGQSIQVMMTYET